MPGLDHFEQNAAMHQVTTYRDISDQDHDAVIALFNATFTASEGADEGAAIAAFVTRMLADTPAPDWCAHVAHQGNTLVAAVVFSRLSYSQDPRSVFILSPMAVAPDHQGQGIGQALIRHGLADLRQCGVDVAVTYGDPAFYTRVGFQTVDTAMVPAPLALSQPQGWLAQDLGAGVLTPLRGEAACVAALNSPDLW